MEYEGDLCVRPRIFARFEDADYYYKSRMVEDLCNAINDAVEKQDEFAEIKNYNSLYKVLSEQLPKNEHADFFKECLLPLADILQNESAKGAFYYLLGGYASNLNMPETSNYYRASALLDYDDAIADEKNFRCNADFVYEWLEKHIANADKGARAQELESILNNLIKESEHYKFREGEFCFKLACLRSNNHLEGFDAYYRRCIVLGEKSVVEDNKFYTEDYESEFLQWFDSSLNKGESISIAKNKCLEKLWQVGTQKSFSKSKKKYVETLEAQVNYVQTCNEYSKFADDGFEWAELWLLKNIKKAEVQRCISDILINRWFERVGEDIELEKVLGLLFDSGRCTSLKSSKYHKYIARYKLAKGEYLASVASFCESVDLEVVKSSGFTTFEKDLRKAVSEKYPTIFMQLLVEHGVQQCSFAKNIERAIGTPEYNIKNVLTGWKRASDIKSFVKKNNHKNDRKYIEEYFKSGKLPGILFRDDYDDAMCSRYLLLKKMYSMALASDGYNMDDQDCEIFKAQAEQFKIRSEQELTAAISDGNLMALVFWVLNRFKECESAALLALFALINEFKPKECPIPFLLFSHYWNRTQPDDTRVKKILQWIINDDETLELWNNASIEELPKMAFKIWNSN